MDIVTSFLLFFAVISFVTCEDVCEVERIQNGDVLVEVRIATRNSTGHQTGTKTIYVPADTSSSTGNGSTLHVRCKGLYRFQGDRAQELAEITCTNGKWVPFPVCLIPPCRKRSLNYPGLDKGGERIYFHGESFEPKCQDGYRVVEKTDKRIHCENGQWTGNLPPCIRVIDCGRPEDPENGKAIYTSLDYKSELTYECSEDLQLSHNEPRICGPDGQWTGTKPTCRESKCVMPGAPEFGTVELVGNKSNAGSTVVYTCASGRKLVGSGISKCLKTGEWTFPTPQCVEPCAIPAVANGELGKYEEQYQRYRWRSVFKKVSEGTILDENEQVTLKCDTDYVTRATPFREITISCQRGQLTPEPECLSASCLGDPPPIENGKAVIRSRSHGFTIWYACDRGFEKVSVGKVQCIYGSWTGRASVCANIAACSMDSLFDIIPEGVVPLIDENIREHTPFGHVLRLGCAEEGHLLTGTNTAMCTAEGKWRIRDDILCIRGCTSLQTKNDSVLLINPNKRFYRMGESVTFSCPKGKELTVDVERILCLRNGWAPDIIPDCQ